MVRRGRVAVAGNLLRALSQLAPSVSSAAPIIPQRNSTVKVKFTHRHGSQFPWSLVFTVFTSGFGISFFDNSRKLAYRPSTRLAGSIGKDSRSEPVGLEFYSLNKSKVSLFPTQPRSLHSLPLIPQAFPIRSIHEKCVSSQVHVTRLPRSSLLSPSNLLRTLDNICNQVFTFSDYHLEAFKKG